MDGVTVDGIIVLRNWDLSTMFMKSRFKPTQTNVERIAEQVQKDHDYWEKRRGKKPMPDA